MEHRQDNERQLQEEECIIERYEVVGMAGSSKEITSQFHWMSGGGLITELLLNVVNWVWTGQFGSQI